MKPKAYGFLVLLWLASAIIAAAQTPPANAPPGPAAGAVIFSTEKTRMDPDEQAAIDRLPKGAPTNGLYCAVDFITHRRGNGLNSVLYVYVVNPTSNLLEGYLFLPPEASLQLSLSDSQGKPIDKTTAGKQFVPWTEQQMEASFTNRLRNLSQRAPTRRISPFSHPQIYGDIRLNELFQLTEPGEYTLHVRLLLVQDHNPDLFGKRQLESIPFPEVAAKVEILPQDIPRAIPVQNPPNQCSTVGKMLSPPVSYP